MSTLGDAVSTSLTKKNFDIDLARIEKVLRDAGVSDTASRGVPSRLRIRHLKVTGVRTLKTDSADTPTLTEPIDLDWAPQDGVNGVGSERNFRGKSSVVHFSMWALTGRSHLQDDVARWVDHVSAEIHVDQTVLHVDFDVSDGVPSGTVAQQTTSSRAVLGSFSGHDEFESVMGSVMLSRLRLDVIPVFADGVETAHMWPTYASSLTVSANRSIRSLATRTRSRPGCCRCLSGLHGRQPTPRLQRACLRARPVGEHADRGRHVFRHRSRARRGPAGGEQGGAGGVRPVRARRRRDVRPCGERN